MMQKLAKAIVATLCFIGAVAAAKAHMPETADILDVFVYAFMASAVTCCASCALFAVIDVIVECHGNVKPQCKARRVGRHGPMAVRVR